MTADSQKSQSQRFIETARELGCDDDMDAFKEKLKVIARQKPTPENAAQTPNRRRGRRSGERDSKEKPAEDA